ncbi:hypothetical protein KAI32_00435 [Candidatus Pacearchaeota archaeon]|nr:hypothetical protein [Candidatus Pacearchaeota archaeon]
MVQVKRDVDDEVIESIKIIFSVNGSSFSSLVPAPDSGLSKVYTFNLSEYGEPGSVSVAPIFVVGNTEKEGSVTSKIDIVEGVILDVADVVYEVGSNYQTIKESCLEILNTGSSIGDGVYDILIGEETVSVYCDMTTDGGGWMMLMKATGSDDTFEYNKNYWTTNNTLNADDLTLDNTNAKYKPFNSLEITQLRATWPSINHIMYANLSTPQTALTRFQTEEDLGNVWTQFDTTNFPFQNGYQKYGFNLHCSTNTPVRWGWEWNNEAICSSNDASAGIGMNYVSGNRAASMGGRVTCCSSLPNGPYPYSVRIWGR